MTPKKTQNHPQIFQSRMERNYLKGKIGDNVNAMLVGCGWNLRKLLQILFLDSFLSKNKIFDNINVKI